MTKTLDEYSRFIAALKALDPGDVKDLIDRRHPEFAAHLVQWKFLEATYEGGRDWFKDNIFKYIKEGDLEYKDRIERAYRFNHTREVVDLVNKYIFKGNVLRNDNKASKSIQKFWKASTLNRRPIEDFMKLVSRTSSTFGRNWVCVDSTNTEKAVTVAEHKASGARLYAYIVKPQNMLDYAYDNNGDLSWAKVREFIRNDDSITDKGETTTQYRIWTKDFWALYVETKGEKDEILYELRKHGEHGLGRVPLFPVDHNSSDNPYTATGLIDDTAYLDRAVANYLSNLDTIIQDQTFSQLVMPAQGLLPGDDAQAKLLELGTKRIFTYDAQAVRGPEYISPDATQASVILNVINKIISEIYHSIGMAGERTKQDNSMGIDNSSGVAKAFDFDRMNAMLASKARSLEICENTICELIDLWDGETVEPATYELVVYPETFDVRGLADELSLASDLQLIGAPDKVRQAQMNFLIDKLFPNLAEDVVAAMKAEVKASWPPEPPEAATTGAPGSSPSKEKKQGQTTKDTVTKPAK